MTDRNREILELKVELLEAKLALLYDQNAQPLHSPPPRPAPAFSRPPAQNYGHVAHAQAELDITHRDQPKAPQSRPTDDWLVENYPDVHGTLHKEMGAAMTLWANLMNGHYTTQPIKRGQHHKYKDLADLVKANTAVSDRLRAWMVSIIPPDGKRHYTVCFSGASIAVLMKELNVNAEEAAWAVQEYITLNMACASYVTKKGRLAFLEKRKILKGAKEIIKRAGGK
jgi:hypothetical protein